MRKVLFALALIAAPMPALADIYLEPGDYPNTAGFPGFSIGSLPLGSHSVLGSLAGNCVQFNDCNPGTAGLDGQDSFTFTIDPGFRLSGLSLTTTNYTGPTGFLASIYIYQQGQAPIFFEPFIVTPGSTSFTTDLAAGTYSYSVYGQRADSAGAYAFDYDAGFTVSGAGGVVPEPASWALMIGGFGLAGAAIRRRGRMHVRFA